jgi:uncharacterized protein YdhG (YjbR/CyaY superfamily)
LGYKRVIGHFDKKEIIKAKDMKLQASSSEEYISQLPDDRRIIIEQIIKVIQENLPKGFLKTVNYGMIGFVVPHTIYPQGYHCDKKQPLPFINIASQKNFVALHHMGLYASPELMNWFVEEYSKFSKTKLDVGKGCIRFKKPEQIPYALIGELCTRMTPQEWVENYESSFVHGKKKDK